MKTVFLDFGNVIGFFNHQRAIQRLLKYTPLSGPELFSILYGERIEEPYEAGQLSTVEYVSAACELGQLNCTRDEFLACFVDIFWPNPDICNIIPKLASQCRLVLASNTNDAHFQKYCQQFQDVLKHFSELCPSHRVGHRKPHPKYFEYCQQHAEAEPGQCLFLDDLPVNIEAAKTHGWNTILYWEGSDVRAELSKFGLDVS